MTSASRWAAALLLVALVAWGVRAAAPVHVVFPCDGPVLIVGGEVLQPHPRGRGPSPSFESLVRGMIVRSCRDDVRIETVAVADGRLVPVLQALVDTIGSLRPALVLLDFPAEGAGGADAVERALETYATLLAACEQASTRCIVGGQRPVARTGSAESEAQRDLERRASQRFPSSYLPLYEHFRSEVPGGTVVEAFVDRYERERLGMIGHDLLFRLHRLRLIELGLVAQP